MKVTILTEDAVARTSTLTRLGLRQSLSTSTLSAIDSDSPAKNCKVFRWRLRRLVTSTWFELLFAALIMGNACTMAVDVQYHGIQAGYKLKYRSSTRSAADAWPHCEQVLDIFDFHFLQV